MSQQEIQNPLTLSEPEQTCNGLVSNCKMRVNELLFPMVHNAMSSQANNFVAYNNLLSLEVSCLSSKPKALFVVVEKVSSTIYSTVFCLSVWVSQSWMRETEREREIETHTVCCSSNGSKQQQSQTTDFDRYWIRPSRRHTCKMII